MADIEIRRTHHLGLDEARRTAQRWIDDGRARFDLVSTVAAGADRDTIHFKRPGVQGTLVAAADHFELTATLGFLLRGFSGAIHAEIERQLDALLAEAGPGARTTDPSARAIEATPAAGPTRRARKPPAAR